MKVCIYVLKDPQDGSVRYVGKSNETRVSKRLNEHCQAKRLKVNRYKENWIKSLLLVDLKPVLEIIETCTSRNWQHREKYWIKYYRKLSGNLTNDTDGGNGSLCIRSRKHSVENREKISRTLKEYFEDKDNLKQCSSAGLKCRGVKKNRRNLSSIYTGVIRVKNGPWQAHISVNYKSMYLGSYHNEILAAESYDKASLHLYGKDVKLNFPYKKEEYLSLDLATWFKQVRSNKKKSSKYKYVSFSTSLKKWISKGIGDIYLGCFETEIEAANNSSKFNGVTVEQLEQFKYDKSKTRKIS